VAFRVARGSLSLMHATRRRRGETAPPEAPRTYRRCWRSGLLFAMTSGLRPPHLAGYARSLVRLGSYGGLHAAD